MEVSGHSAQNTKPVGENEGVRKPLRSHSLLLDSTICSSKGKTEWTSSDVWKYVQTAWDYVYSGAKWALSMLFCRCFCRPEKSLDLHQLLLETGAVNGEEVCSLEQRVSLFEKYPEDFRNDMMKCFSAISKEKVKSSEKLLAHPHFRILFPLFTAKFFTEANMRIFEKILKKVGNPSENLRLFAELPFQIQNAMSIVLLEAAGMGKSAEERIKLVQEKSKIYLSKQKFEEFVKQFQALGKMEVQVISEALSQMKKDYKENKEIDVHYLSQVVRNVAEQTATRRAAILARSEEETSAEPEGSDTDKG